VDAITRTMPARNASRISQKTQRHRLKIPTARIAISDEIAIKSARSAKRLLSGPRFKVES
jgi:hypothetical protein